MTLQGILKFTKALETAGIKTWEAVSDVSPTHFFNADNCFNVIDEAEETIYNFSSTNANSDTYGSGRIVVKGAHLSDIHEVRCAGELKEVQAFIDAYGLPLTDEQTKILIKINATNYNLKPATGDYTFKELSEEEISKLSEEAKAKYELELANFKKSKRMQSAVQVTC